MIGHFTIHDFYCPDDLKFRLRNFWNIVFVEVKRRKVHFYQLLWLLLFFCELHCEEFGVEYAFHFWIKKISTFESSDIFKGKVNRRTINGWKFLIWSSCTLNSFKISFARLLQSAFHLLIFFINIYYANIDWSYRELINILFDCFIP